MFLRNTILTFVVLMAGYSMTLRWNVLQHHPEDILWGQNFNKIEAYHLDHTDPAESVVVVGSSLSGRLVWANLDENIYDLTLPGMGFSEGIEALLAKKEKPKACVIEINFPITPINEQFVKSSNSTAHNYIKQFLPALRNSHKPVDEFGQLIIESISNSSGKKEGEDIQPPDPTMLAAIHAELDYRYSADIREKQMTRLMTAISKYVLALESANIQVIFYEMPTDPSLMDLPYAIRVRNEFEQYFPSGTYEHISLPEGKSYTTTDGLHLDKKSSASFTSYFHAELQYLLD